MKILPILKKLLFPSLLGFVLTSSLSSVSPEHLVTRVLSLTNESEEITSPKVTEIASNTTETEDTQNIKEQDDATEQRSDNMPTPKESAKQETQQEKRVNNNNQNEDGSSDAPVAKVTVDSSGVVTAKTTIENSGKTIHLTMKYPKKGGAVTGSMSGDCDGTISGNYSPTGEGSMKGTAKAKCPAGFVPIPVTIAFHSNFLPDDSEATIYYTVTALGKTQKGSTPLLLA